MRVERARLRALAAAPAFWPGVFLAALIVLNALVTDGFAALELRDGRLWGVPIDVLHRSVPVLLVALGMTAVIGTKGIDLSVGTVMALGAAIAALLLSRTALPVPAVIALALSAGGALGAWNGALVAGLRIQPIVATLVLLVSGRGLAQVLTGGQMVSFDRPGFHALAAGSLLGLPLSLFLGAGVLVLLAAAMRKTALGLYVEAIGDNEKSAHLAGLPIAGVKIAVYALSGVLAALAGMLVCAEIEAADVNNCGLYWELDAILAVVIGGTPLAGGRTSLCGTLFGALIIQTLTTSLLMSGLGFEATLVVKAAAVLFVCALRSPALADLLRRRGARAGAAA